MTNRELVRSLYDAFARGDAETVLGTLDPDVVWMEAESNPYADRNPYRGPQEVGEGLFSRLMSEWEDFRVDPRSLVAEGNDVVAFGRYTGTWRETGRSLDAQFVHRWTVEDGRIVRFQQYTDTAQFRSVMGTD